MTTTVKFWQGPSLLDPSAEIALYLTFKSKNAKTGDMVQATIMRTDTAPHVAQRTGADAAVCGDCPLRPANGGGCYVTTFQAPNAIHRSHSADTAIVTTEPLAKIRARLAGRSLRIGAYGDPAAVPAAVWHWLIDAAEGRAVGYTHSPEQGSGPQLRPYCMASTDYTDTDRANALRRAGWRLFHVTSAKSGTTGHLDTPTTFQCPSETTGGRVQCIDCMLCNGAQRPAQRHAVITIRAHGTTKNRI
jgi:hypothetical protein